MYGAKLLPRNPHWPAYILCRENRSSLWSKVQTDIVVAIAHFTFFFTLRFKRWILAILILISFTSALRIAPPSQSSLTRPSSLSGKPVSRVDQNPSVQTDIDEAIAHFTFLFRFLFTIDANARLHHILVFLVATRKRMETWIAGSEGKFLLAINNQERRKVDGAWLARWQKTMQPFKVKDDLPRAIRIYQSCGGRR